MDLCMELETLFASLAVTLTVVNAGQVYGGTTVLEVGTCNTSKDAQVCHADDGSILCTCQQEVGEEGDAMREKSRTSRSGSMRSPVWTRRV